jgi:hypothetical protein
LFYPPHGNDQLFFGETQLIVLFVLTYKAAEQFLAAITGLLIKLGINLMRVFALSTCLCVACLRAVTHRQARRQVFKGFLTFRALYNMSAAFGDGKVCKLQPLFIRLCPCLYGGH